MKTIAPLRQCLVLAWLGALLHTPMSASVGAPAPVDVVVFPDQPRQTVRGLGFEIQCDSIGSGNHGLPEEPIGVPHDLVPAERVRLAHEMLKGFRYCRLAGGLYWRGLDAEEKHLRPRWPEQLQELEALLRDAGVEGLSFEYWSPPPYWKGNRSYRAGGSGPAKLTNRLRCFAPGFSDDPVYHGDTDRFLHDFAEAVVADLKTLAAAGLKVSMWGLQNEPFANVSIYSTCEYPDSASYVKAYAAVAAAVRHYDPHILLFADTDGSFPKKIGPGMKLPAVAALVDAYAVHIVGSSSETPAKVAAAIGARLPARPWFQNEYEYLTGGATPERCLNTVQHIMNSFQLAGNPTWFWIHCLKPLNNAEASGYSLGFWRSLAAGPKPDSAAEAWRRWPAGPRFTKLPTAFQKMEMLSLRHTPDATTIAWNFFVNQPVTVFLLVQKGVDPRLGSEWKQTAWETAWEGGADTVFERTFPPGKIEIPAPSAAQVPHSAFVEPSDPARLKLDIGMNLPIEVRSHALALERQAAAVSPGHWIYNPYNWNAVGSFLRRMPWDSVVLQIEEAAYNPDARILAFRKPDGKLTLVLSNRTAGECTFAIKTGLDGATFEGFRYTPDDAGQNTMGVALGASHGGTLSAQLPRLSWEFWEQQ